MKKAVFLVSVAAALFTTAMATPSPAPAAGQDASDGRRARTSLKDGRMIVEWAPGEEAVVKISAESAENLRRIRILRPDGEELIDLDAGHRRLASLEIEFREPDLARLLESYPEGRYDIRAVTVGEALATGSARLSFDLPPPPRIVHPYPGQIVEGRNLTVSWLAEPGVAAYEVEIEQGDDDGLRIRLPPAQTSLSVPSGFLRRGVDTSLDVVAIHANGNRTVSEVEFLTVP